MDLMEMVKGAVTKSVMEKMGGMVGQSPAKAPGIFDAVAGSVLGGLIKKAGSPGGAEEIFRAAQKQDTGVLDRLGDLMGGGAKTEEVQKSGMGVLDMIFGGDRSGMLGAIAKTLGIDASKLSGLLAMIAPIIMGVISKYVKNKALNAAGLGSFLGEQKNSLGNYLPAGLGNQLGFGNLMSNVKQSAAAVQSTASDFGRAANQAGKAVARESKSALPMILLMSLLGLAAVGGLWWWVTPKLTDLPATGSGRGAPVANQDGGSQSSGEATQGAMGMTVIPPDFGGFKIDEFAEVVATVTKGMEKLDLESAPKFVETVTEVTGKLGTFKVEGLTGLPQKLAAQGIANQIKLVEASMSKVTDTKILEIIKPVIAKLIEALKGMRT